MTMADLRGLCESAGIHNPRTYIQSGNIVFESDESASILECSIAEAIEKKFGFKPDVMVIKAEDFIRTSSGYPFATDNHKLAHIQFLQDKPQMEDIDEILSADYEPDKIAIVDKAVYMYLANGVSESTIDFKKLERTLKTSGTARNWRTVQKLVDMISGK